MEEKEENLTQFLNVDGYQQKLPGKTQESARPAYKSLFLIDLLEDIVETCT